MRKRQSTWLEVQLGLFALAISVICGSAIAVMFVAAEQGAYAGSMTLGRLWMPMWLAVLGLAGAFGYAMGGSTRDSGADFDVSLADAYHTLQDIAGRELRSGNAIHLAAVGQLSDR